MVSCFLYILYILLSSQLYDLRWLLLSFLLNFLHFFHPIHISSLCYTLLTAISVLPLLPTPSPFLPNFHMETRAEITLTANAEQQVTSEASREAVITRPPVMAGPDSNGLLLCRFAAPDMSFAKAVIQSHGITRALYWMKYNEDNRRDWDIKMWKVQSKYWLGKKVFWLWELAETLMLGACSNKRWWAVVPHPGSVHR